MRFAPVSAPSRRDVRRHDIPLVAALHTSHDWGEQALERTWRSAGNLFFALGVLNAFVARLPAFFFLILGVWAHLKANPHIATRVARQPVWGAPMRWWLQRSAAAKHVRHGHGRG